MLDVLAGVDRQRLVDRFGESAVPWFDDLPALVVELAHRWQLEVGALLPAGSNSVVLDCGDVVLKLTPDPRIATDEAAALTAWAGCRHSVQLVDADTGRGAVLLEAVRPGTPLAADPAGWTLTDVAPVLGELHGVTAPIGAYAPLAERVELVFDLFDARLLRTPAVASRVPAGVVTAARDRARALAAGGEVGLLHGDLHPGNVLRAAGRVVAIDPRPCLGDRACDTVDWVLADVVDDAGLAGRIDGAVTLVPGLDGARVRAWCEAFAPLVAASLLTRRLDDPVGEFVLRLAQNPG